MPHVDRRRTCVACSRVRERIFYSTKQLRKKIGSSKCIDCTRKRPTYEPGTVEVKNPRGKSVCPPIFARINGDKFTVTEYIVAKDGGYWGNTYSSPSKFLTARQGISRCHSLYYHEGPHKGLEIGKTNMTTATATTNANRNVTPDVKAESSKGSSSPKLPDAVACAISGAKRPLLPESHSDQINTKRRIDTGTAVQTADRTGGTLQQALTKQSTATNATMKRLRHLRDVNAHQIQLLLNLQTRQTITTSEPKWSWDASSPLLETKVFELRGPHNSVAAKIGGEDYENCMMAAQVMEAGTGKHTISMQLLLGEAGGAFSGVVSDGAACNEDHSNPESTVGWFVHSSGALFGNGKDGDDHAGAIKSGDVLTMQVDIDAGTLKFWVNGKPHGPGYTSGVRGPLRWATSIYFEKGASVKIVPTPNNKLQL